MRPARPLALVALLTMLAAPAMAQDAALRRESSAFTLDTGHARTPEQTAMRFDHAALSIRVIPADKAIAATAELTFTAEAPLERLAVELDRRFDISAIRVDGEAVAADRWSNPEGRLTVELSRPLPAGQAVVLSIAYAGQPREAVNAPWDGGFVWRTTASGEPWIATAVQGEGCDLFWPCIDHPMAEPARMDINVTVPSGLSAPSNGRLLGVEDHGDGWTTWRWTARQPNTYAIALNVGPYEEMTGVYESRFGNRIPLHFWRLKETDPADAAALFAELPRQLDFFEAVVGPYPFADEKLGVVETPHLGMEHQTINAYGNRYRRDGNGFDWLLQHELSHEWFGNQMTNATWDDMWLHEGFGTYMQPLYAGWLNGARNYQAGMQTQRESLHNRFPIVSGRPLTGKAVYNGETGPGVDIYYKGSQVLHTLRLLIGDDAFYEATRRLVYGRPDPRPGDFQPRYATTTEFIAIVNATTGRDLGWFFDAYLHQAALPDLVETRDGERLTLEWRTGDGGPFPMPIEIAIDGERRMLPMLEGRTTLTVPARAHVLIDPDSRVLRRLEAIDQLQAWRARARN